MTRLHLLLAAPLVLLAACGSSDPTNFTIVTGQYNVSAGTATAAQPTDNCNMVALFTAGNPPIDVAVSGTTANFDLKGGQTQAQFKTTANIVGNQIEHVTDANFETVVGAACVFVTRVQVHGDLTGDNAMHLVAKYDIATKAGTTCSLADVDAKVLPCTSEVDFLATKVP